MASKLFQRLQGRALALHQDCHALIIHGKELRPRDVHRLRVNMKELRALWQVIKPFTDAALVAQANLQLAGTARELAGARDLHVGQKTLDRLMRKAPTRVKPALSHSRERFTLYQTALSTTPSPPSHLPVTLHEDSVRWQSLMIQASKRELVSRGYGGLYKSARKQFKLAAQGHQKEDWHKLRKWTKYLGLTLPLIHKDNRMHEPAKAFAKLSEKLGELHDLDHLADWLTALNNSSDPLLTEAVTYIEHKADQLRRRCGRMASTLLKEPSGRALQAMTKC
ncbi:MAG: CHAD domain-containing protein [Marinobacter sp.]|nr:CHAD domain-containing protein [Marinobacter sp.]